MFIEGILKVVFTTKKEGTKNTKLNFKQKRRFIAP
jgi:hypothetical protein